MKSQKQVAYEWSGDPLAGHTKRAEPQARAFAAYIMILMIKMNILKVLLLGSYQLPWLLIYYCFKK